MLQLQEMNSTAQYSFRTRGMTRAINSARLALFIHRITSAKRTCEVWPALYLLEKVALSFNVSLDMYVSYLNI